MSLLPVFQWLAHSAFGVLMQESKWAFAIVEMVHLLALALLGGAVLIVDLGLLGLGLRRQPIGHIARELTPLFASSLVVMAVSGVVLLSEEALKCYYSPAFRAKMALLLLAVLFSITLHRSVIRSSITTQVNWKRRAAAVISLLLWLGVGLAGRAIGFL